MLRLYCGLLSAAVAVFVGRDIANPNKTQPHGSRMHLSYLDGHVAALSPEDAARPEHWVIQ